MTGVTAGAIIGFIGAAADFTAGFLAAFRLAGFFFPAFFFAAFFLDFLAAFFFAGFRFFAAFFFAAFFLVDFRFVLRFFAFLAFFAVFFFAAFFFVAMVMLLSMLDRLRAVPSGPAAAYQASGFIERSCLVALDRYFARFVEAFSTRTSLVKRILDAGRDVKRDYLSGLGAFWYRGDTNQGSIARSSVRSPA